MKHTDEAKRKISVGAINTMKQSNAGFKQIVSCPSCGQDMNPANLGRHKDVCKSTRGMFLNGKELSVKEIKSLRKVLKTVGWNVDDYINKHNEQNGLCFLCKSPPRKGRLSADHCHARMVARELLCENCNIGLGAFRDDEGLLESAINYLRRFKHEASQVQNSQEVFQDGQI